MNNVQTKLLPTLVGVGLLLCCTFGNAQSNPKLEPGKLGRITFPLTWARSLGHGPPIVEVVLNHQVHATFTFDTGSSNTLITESIAKQLGIKSETLRDAAGKPVLDFGKRPLRTITVQSLAINPDNIGQQGILDTHADLLVQPGKTLFAGALQHFDGILGMNLLKYFTIYLDPDSHEITLFTGRSLTKAERQQLDMSDAVTLPLVERDGIMQVQVRLNDAVDVMLPIDTGSETTCIPTKVSDLLHLEANGPGREFRTLYGHGNVLEAYVLKMTVGSIERQHQLLSYSDSPKLVNEALGINILCDYRLLMDVSSKTLWLKPITPDSMPPVNFKAGKDKP